MRFHNTKNFFFASNDFFEKTTLPHSVCTCRIGVFHYFGHNNVIKKETLVYIH